MTIEEAIATQPQWIQWWVSWMGIAMLGTMLVLVFSRATRIDALVILVTSIAAYFVMTWLYGQVGYVRLLGIVHIVIWTPLAFYFWRRLKAPEIQTPFRQAIWVFLGTITISLLFDYADVVRFLLGERGSMIS